MEKLKCREVLTLHARRGDSIASDAVGNLQYVDDNGDLIVAAVAHPVYEK
jgi:hypothetical protein